MSHISRDKVKSIVESIILPKYPFLYVGPVGLYETPNHFVWVINFYVERRLDYSLESEIKSEVGDLFVMLGLNKIQKGKESLDSVDVVFNS